MFNIQQGVFIIAKGLENWNKNNADGPAAAPAPAQAPAPAAAPATAPFPQPAPGLATNASPHTAPGVATILPTPPQDWVSTAEKMIVLA